MGREPGRPGRAERRRHGDSSGGAPPGAGPRWGLSARREVGDAAGSRPPPSPPFRRRSPGARLAGRLRAGPAARQSLPGAAGRADPRASRSGTSGPLGAGRAAARQSGARSPRCGSAGGSSSLIPGFGRGAASGSIEFWSREPLMGWCTLWRGDGDGGRCLWSRVPSCRPSSDLPSLESAPLPGPPEI